MVWQKTVRGFFHVKSPATEAERVLHQNNAIHSIEKRCDEGSSKIAVPFCLITERKAEAHASAFPI